VAIVYNKNKAERGDLLGGRQEKGASHRLQNLAETVKALSPKEAKER
jgi:hypothetical protein